ncbi:MAG: hypothetical protein IID05_11090 [Gemmatimonadetes bacterium]|nr:hypothetical protein [Gemmatimonadota bacterium]
MLSYQVYKILHLVSLFGVFMCLGALVIHHMNGGAKHFPARMWLVLSFAIFMFLAFVGGFGLMARLGSGMQTWIYAKIALWLVIGAYMSVIARKPDWSKVHWFVLLVLGATGASVALYKPF